jgi:hypothetical protein
MSGRFSLSQAAPARFDSSAAASLSNTLTVLVPSARFEDVVRLEPADAADDLPNLVFVCNERVGQFRVAGVGAEHCVHRRDPFCGVDS